MKRVLEGLRGVAISSVLAFHLLPDTFKNGFLGVDIFLVLSGYLMATILSRQKSITLSVLLDFYTRRFKRIVPLYALVLVGITLVSPFVFLESDIEKLMDGLMWAMPFAENLKLVLQRQGYFTQVFNSNVLLHTWSLGVEVQWYLVVPLVVRGQRFFKSLESRSCLTLVLMTGSLCIYLTAEEKVAFALVFSRAWQFLTGNLAHSLSQSTSLSSGLVSTTIYKLGIFLLAFLVFYTGDMPAELARIVSTVLTGALLYGGCFLRTNIVSHRFLVYIGDVSYALYLVHWPIIVYTQRNFTTIPHLVNHSPHKFHQPAGERRTIRQRAGEICVVNDSLVLALLLSSTLLLSILVHHSIESLFVRSSTWTSLVAVSISYCLLFATTATPLLSTIGHLFRSSFLEEDVRSAIAWNDRVQRYAFPLPSGVRADGETARYHKYRSSKELENYLLGNGTASILMIGNSFAMGEFHAILASYQQRFAIFRLYAQVGCSMFQFLSSERTRTFHCDEYVRAWRRVVVGKKPDVIIVVARDGMLLNHKVAGDVHVDPFFINITKYMDFLCSHAKVVVLQSHTVQPFLHGTTRKAGAPSTAIAKRLLREGWRARFDDLAVPYEEFESRQKHYRSMLKALNYSNLIIDDIGPLMCDEDKMCRMYNQENLHAYYADATGHLTEEALSRLAPHFKLVADRVLTRLNA